MEIKFVEQWSGYDGPVLDILPDTEQESFILGVLLQKFVHRKKCIWTDIRNSSIRIPLIDQSDIGLAIMPLGMKIENPLSANEIKEHISTVLFALAGQNNCDGVPYDQMQIAGEYILQLEKQIKELKERLENHDKP